MNLLITGAWKDAKEYFSQIEEMGNQIMFLQYENEKLPCSYEWVEGVICNGLFRYHSIEKFVHLKYIQLTSAGYDRILLEYINEHKIVFYNAKDVYSIPMAEWAVMSILTLYKNAPFFFKKQQQKIWEKDRTLLELTNKKVCIIGYGSVGRETAKRLSVFGTEIIAVNRSKIKDEYIQRYVPLELIDTVLPEADIVILSIALAEETIKFMNSRRLECMKKGSILINISRGAILDEESLLCQIKNKKIRGAALDVFEKEPLPTESELWNNLNVIVSPHNSFVGDYVKQRLFDLIYNNLKYTKKY